MGTKNTTIGPRRGILAVVLVAALSSLCGVGCGEKETVVDTASNGTATGRTEKRVCPKCGRQYFNGENYCLYDRTQLVAASALKATEKVCPVCGRKYPPIKNFCVVDGTALVEVSATAASVAQGDGSSPGAPVTPKAAPTGSEAAVRGNTLPTRVEQASRSTDTRVASREPVPGERHPTSSRRTTTAAHTTGEVHGNSAGKSSRNTSSWQAPSTPRPSRYVPPPTPRPSRYVPPPTPVPVRATPVPPTPRPSRYVPPPTPVPVRATPVPPPPLPVATPAPVAVAKVEPPPDSVKQPSVPPPSADDLFADFEATSTKAAQGKLSPTDVAALEAIGMSDPNFTRSRALLAMNYKRRDTDKYYKALTELMSLPENKYNPMYNLELAEYYLLAKAYRKSVEQARTVDRFKQRLPRSVYFQSVARMYEVQAKAYEGRFNETEDPEYLDKAISVWKRYITLVSKKDQADRVKMAQEYIAKLEKIKRRLE